MRETESAMALPALKFEREDPVEERITRLETNVENIQSDIAEMKATIQKLTARIDYGTMWARSSKLDRLYDHLWWFLFGAFVITVMARGFKLI